MSHFWDPDKVSTAPTEEQLAAQVEQNRLERIAERAAIDATRASKPFHPFVVTRFTKELDWSSKCWTEAMKKNDLENLRKIAQNRTCYMFGLVKKCRAQLDWVADPVEQEHIELVQQLLDRVQEMVEEAKGFLGPNEEH